MKSIEKIYPRLRSFKMTQHTRTPLSNRKLSTATEPPKTVHEKNDSSQAFSSRLFVSGFITKVM